MQVITENTALPLVLVATLVGLSFSAALFLTRFVTKGELRLVVTEIRDGMDKLDEKLSRLIFSKKD